MWEKTAYPDTGTRSGEKWVLDEVKRSERLSAEVREALEVLVRETGAQEEKWLRTVVKAAEALAS